MRNRFSLWFVSLLVASAGSPAPAADTFRVATYNVENYLDQPTESRPQPKSAIAKARVRECIRALNPDVLALEEMGGPSALLELRSSLKAEGLDLPYWELVSGEDTNIHVAVLSKLPIVARRPHTNEVFLLDGRRFHISRGFVELDIRAAPDFTFTLIAAHLKSRRAVPEADEAEQRLHEARILRHIVDRDFAAHPNVKLIVLGDFNDVKDSDSTREIIGRGRFRLVDTRPAEHNGDNAPAENSWSEPRNVTWTHYFGKEDTYSRIDYILLSPGMARAWDKNDTYVLTLTNWGVASDHRPIVATFKVGNN
ncbi:MAG TPA: endonuclease/exonuclease/phosphatase family protein [Verrucomicrobiae bacterium]|nr:endonuclease/exonuclease/phosphatase family protein [Verrucomicrobiae bacterium]